MATDQPAQTFEGLPRRWVGLFVVLSAAFMQLMDISIVNVAIPSIQKDIGASFAQIQLVVAGYQLAYAVLLITGGRLGDIHGRKKLFQIGMGGFVAASAACGLAHGPWFLIGARIVQGLFASLMYPQVLAIIQVSFPMRERAKAFGIFGATIGIATIAGPLLGGLLIEWNLFGLMWRPIFLVNVLIGIPALIAAAAVLEDSRAENANRLDVVGTVLVALALSLLIWPLSIGRETGWPWWAWTCLGLSVPVLAFFAVYERDRTRRDASPLVDFNLFQDRAFDIGLLIACTFFMGIPAFFFTFTLFLQIGLGYSALGAGLTTLPWALGAVIASTASIKLAPRFGRGVLSIGTLLLTAAMGGIIATVVLAKGSVSGFLLAPALFVGGLGMGTTVAPLINIVLAGIHGRHAGSASGVLTTVQQVGGAIGVAVIGVVYFGQLGAHADVAAQKQLPALRAELAAASIPPPAIEGMTAGFTRCFHDRANAREPGETPASCREGMARAENPAVPAPTRQAIGSAMQKAARGALQDNFSDAFGWSVVFEVAVFALVFLLVFALPKPSRQKLGAPAEPAAA